MPKKAPPMWAYGRDTGYSFKIEGVTDTYERAAVRAAELPEKFWGGMTRTTINPDWRKWALRQIKAIDKLLDSICPDDAPVPQPLEVYHKALLDARFQLSRRLGIIGIPESYP